MPHRYSLAYTEKTCTNSAYLCLRSTPIFGNSRCELRNGSLLLYKLKVNVVRKNFRSTAAGLRRYNIPRTRDERMSPSSASPSWNERLTQVGLLVSNNKRSRRVSVVASWCHAVDHSDSRTIWYPDSGSECNTLVLGLHDFKLQDDSLSVCIFYLMLIMTIYKTVFTAVKQVVCLSVCLWGW